MSLGRNVWPALFGAAALVLAWQADGYAYRRLLVGLMAGAWAFRVSTFALLASEKGEWRRAAAPVAVQVMAGLLLAVPVWFAGRNAAHPLNGWDAAGLALWIIGVFGGMRADKEAVRRQRRKGAAAGAGPDPVGFDCVHWAAYVAMGWSVPYGWMTAAGPVVRLGLWAWTRKQGSESGN